MVASMPPLKLRAYIAVLGVLLVGVIAGSLVSDPDGLTEGVSIWLALIALFGITEYVDLFYLHERGRLSVSPSEALLFPMIVGLTTPQLVIGISVAMAVVKSFHLREGWLKWVFNIAQYGIAAAAAATIYGWLSESAGTLTPQNAVAGGLSVAVFAISTHAFVAGAIAFAEGKRYFPLLRSVAPTAALSLAGSVSLGLLYGAAFLAASWTIGLFILPIILFFLGYRAVLRQARERERVSNLLEASRALASTRSLDEALTGFLRAVQDVVSAQQAMVVIRLQRDLVHSRLRGDEALASLAPVDDAAMRELFETIHTSPNALIVNQDEIEGYQDAAAVLDARSFVCVPVRDGDEVVGCLVATDRVGAEEFGRNEAQLMEALSNELVLTLDSYRLFEQVVEERERFQKIFEGSKEGIALLDEHGFIQAWNPALERITGYHEEDILGESWSERVLVRDMDHRRVEGMDIVKVRPDEELEVVTRQGPARWVSLLTGQVQTGEDKQWVIIVRDITAEHEIEEAKSDFLSTISHELRTPLTTIKGSLQMLGRPAAAPQSDVGKQMVDIMRRGADRLERLVMNLLTVSQMETGDLQIFPDEVTLQTLVESRIKTVLIDHLQVELNAEEEVVVRADRERLGQVVEHLLDNARKFGGPDGRITIDITKQNGYALLSVTDEGPGIPRHDQERVFDRFTRLGHLLTRETQGAGVGLFIAKTAVEAMAGEIFVESDGHNGSTFQVRIPLAQPVAVQEPATSA